MARKTSLVPIGQIETDRLAIRPKTLTFALALMRGASFPPVSVQRRTDGRLRILDGRHRVTAHKLVGLKTVLARYSTKQASR